MANNEVETRKLKDLRVTDLKAELEKRDLDKTGVKAILLERLQNALKDEGHDPDTFTFELANDAKRTPGKGKAEEDKGEDDDDPSYSEKDKDNKEISNAISKSDDKDTKLSDNKLEGGKEVEKIKDESSTTTVNNKTLTESKISDSENKKGDEESNKENDNIPDIEDKKKPIEDQSDNTLADKSKNVEKKEDVKTEDAKTEDGKTEDAKIEEVPAPKEDKIPAKSPIKNTTLFKTPIASVKEDKSAPDTNGTVDNEDSINLTIGEEEAKMLADEEESSQEKDSKDESHGRTGHKKISVGEKSQDKSNQEKMDGKSTSVGDKAAKDDKNKKPSGVTVSNSRNLWVSGLATTTRATDLKQLFSNYGKVIGAKVVTNARTPGARCYGYVTMAQPDDANKAVQFLHHTELHGRLISVEKAKGDSTGPPKRLEPAKAEPPVKKGEEKKKDPIVRKLDLKKEETLVPPGTEGDLKEPEAPGTEKEVSEKEGGHRSRELVRVVDRPTKRPLSTTSSHRSRGGSPILTFDQIMEEREKQRLRERERLLREEERRRETERMRQREIDRKQREEFDRLDREKKKLKMERERLLREKDELLKLKSERQRLERERQKLEREKIEKEKEELERLKRVNMRLEEEARRKRSLSASRDYESRKRPTSDTRYVGHHSSQSRYPEPPSRSSEYKKDTSHKSSRDLAVPARRPAYEPDARRMVTSISSSSRENWTSKERESGRYERSSVSSSSFRDDSISSRSKPSESRHVRERYEPQKGDRFVERSESWHTSGSSGPLKTFSSRDTWVSGDRKQEVTEPWARPSTNSSRWPASNSSIGISNRSGPPSVMTSPVFASTPVMPSMNMGMSIGSFSGGDRFDAYKQSYFK